MSNSEESTLTIIVPCYNEEDNVEATIKEISITNPSAIILIVDDHSSDKTPEIVLRYDVEKFSNDKNISLSELYLNDPIRLKFILTDEQLDIIKRSLELYTSSDIGVSRILTKVFVKKILRRGISDSESLPKLKS